ncbi:MAG: UvrD-helicase domain-containing protein [Vicinamibacterales bacterium]
MASLDLPFGPDDEVESRLDARDREGRARAVDPRFNVALEASAGTGKTRVLVDRYVNLLKAGVDPSHVLAVTFTRKAAAEMRERIVTTLGEAAAVGEITPVRWRALRDRVGDIGVSTIDAFCLSLLREFPLEADLEPGFSLADETEAPRLIDESLDRALRICRELARTDEHVALVFAQLGDRRARRGLAALLNRRLVAPDVLGRFMARGPRDLTVTDVVDRAARALVGMIGGVRGGLDGFIATGPLHPGFHVLARELRRLETTLDEGGLVDPAAVQSAYARTREYFLTREGLPRQRQLPFKKTLFVNDAAWRLHRAIVFEHGGEVVRIAQSFRRDLNVLVARGTWRMYRVAETEYRRTLDAHAVLDFPEVLLKAIALLKQMEEFSQSRFRLESRYHHVLVDEFQDTSRAQWELMALLVQAWGAGVGAAHEGPLAPSIFIVGDLKQSIYGFRDADVSLLREAAKYLDGLRPEGDVRRSISRSFRSVPPLLAFVNDLCHDIEKVDRRDGFRFDEQDRFPLLDHAAVADSPLGLVTGNGAEACAEATAAEIARLIASRAVVRDRETGVRRDIVPSDVAVLFRTRESHREYEHALEQRGISTRVYKGLGFFDADEIKDVRALIAYLADPASDLRAAAVLRSRLVRVSDEALRLIAPRVAMALRHGLSAEQGHRLEGNDRVTFDRAWRSFERWRQLVDRIPPAELLDLVLRESGYGVELRGPRFEQARENLKKVRALVRRLQNRGYATLSRVAEHMDHLAIGHEANAPLDARNAVSLMTVHASKGLEFPVVFLVNLTRGTAGYRDPIRISTDSAADSVSVSIGDFLSEADDDAAPREREETKRLLYVALTRARDRLYFATALKDGQLQVGRGSLAEVMPASLVSLLASPADGSSVWVGSAGRAHTLSRTSRAIDVQASGPPAANETPNGDGDDPVIDREPIQTRVSTRTAALRTVGTTGHASDVPAPSDRLIGIAVHRLLQRYGLTPSWEPVDAASSVIGVLRREERAELEDAVRFVDAVLEAYTCVCGEPAVREAYMKGQCLHEVPFSLKEAGGLIRGTIDCLARLDERNVLVLEFKTGRPRPEHDDQVALYCRAARALFPACHVDSRLIYASKP